jgi:hypothetical protein
MKTLRIIILFISVLLLLGADRPACSSQAACEKRAGLAIEVISWTNKKFVLLEKPSIYCNYGYDLYSCPQLEKCRDAVDTALFTKYHRARCDRFAGHSLRVSAIEKRGAERIVTFKDSAAGKKLYAVTTGGVFHEVAYADDLDSARKRWQDKTVFSARGFITDFQEGRVASVKVDLRDPLRVTGVRFGLTPLPAKPLWLMVETPVGRKGVIPLCYSWTNVKKALRHEGNPWDDDLFETDPRQVCTADSLTWETMNAHHVNIGMTRGQVRMSWGRPQARDTAEYRGVPHECWTYEKQLLYFDEKGLKGTEEKGN